MPRTREEFSVLDWIGVSVTVVATAGLASFPFTVVPAFRGMFESFGGELPAITKAVMSGWPGGIAALIAAGLLGGGIFAQDRPIAARRAWVVVGFLVAFAGLAVCLGGLYAPIFSLAGQIE